VSVTSIMSTDANGDLPERRERTRGRSNSALVVGSNVMFDSQLMHNMSILQDSITADVRDATTTDHTISNDTITAIKNGRQISFCPSGPKDEQLELGEADKTTIGSATTNEKQAGH
jgi:hypothetical protein